MPVPVSAGVARVAAAARPVGAYARLEKVAAAAAAQIELGAFQELVQSLLADPTPTAPAIDWSELGGARPEWLADDDPLLDVLAQLEPPGARAWRNQARTDQLPPDGDWLHWLIMSGRGWGKTWTGANVLAEWAVTQPGDYAVVAPTFGDARKICVEGPSGLLQALGDDLLDYNKSEFIVYVRGGSRIMLASADVPDRLRGLNLRGAWLDELASYRNGKDLWDAALLPALRIGRLPRTVITTTPRRGNPVLKELLDRASSGDPEVVVVRGATRDNFANLSPAFIKAIYKRYEGTRLGRQELEGELLPDVEGALLRAALLELTRIRSVESVPNLRRIVVGVDPSGSGKDSSDRCGLVVVGIGPPPIGVDHPDGIVEGEHLYFLEDASERLSPERWATRALDLAEEWGADTIVAEKNMGHDMVETMIRMVARAQKRKKMPRIVPVWAARNKQARAEPVAGVWEQFRAHVVGGMPGFEDCWTSWVAAEGKPSPDPLDAGVWGACELMPELALGTATEVQMVV